MSSAPAPMLGALLLGALALGALVTPAAALDCQPWSPPPRLRVRRTASGVLVRLRGRLRTPTPLTDAGTSLTIFPGMLGRSTLLAGDRGLVLGHQRVRARARLSALFPSLPALPATVVLATPGWCVTALFEASRCHGGRRRRRCRAVQTMPPPSDVPALADAAGTYEGTYRSGGASRPVLAAIVDAANGTATLQLRRSPYETTALGLAVRPDGRLALGGYCVPSDVVSPATGVLSLVRDESGIHLDGDLECDGAAGTLALGRPAGESPSFSGAYALTLTDSTSGAGSTTLALSLLVDATGAASSARTTDRTQGGMDVGTAETGLGLVGPQGLMSLSAEYRPVGDDGSWVLALFGRLVPMSGLPSGGTFYVGGQPTIARAGTWTVAPVP